MKHYNNPCPILEYVKLDALRYNCYYVSSNYIIVVLFDSNIVEKLDTILESINFDYDCKITMDDILEEKIEGLDILNCGKQIQIHAFRYRDPSIDFFKYHGLSVNFVETLSHAISNIKFLIEEEERSDRFIWSDILAISFNSPLKKIYNYLAANLDINTYRMYRYLSRDDIHAIIDDAFYNSVRFENKKNFAEASEITSGVKKIPSYELFISELKLLINRRLYKGFLNKEDANYLLELVNIE